MFTFVDIQRVPSLDQILGIYDVWDSSQSCGIWSLHVNSICFFKPVGVSLFTIAAKQQKSLHKYFSFIRVHLCIEKPSSSLWMLTSYWHFPSTIYILVKTRNLSNKWNNRFKWFKDGVIMFYFNLYVLLSHIKIGLDSMSRVSITF